MKGLAGFATAILLATLAAAAESPSTDLTGVWVGSVKLSNDSLGGPCAYAADAPAVRLELMQEKGQLRGFASLEAPGTLGSACPPLHKRYRIRGATVSGGSVSFRDAAGQQWTLGLREGRLTGLLEWKADLGRDEPLAEGFQVASGEVPLTRLSGEVALTKKGEPAPAAPPAPRVAAAPSPKPTGPAQPAQAAASPAPATQASATAPPPAEPQSAQAATSPTSAAAPAGKGGGGPAKGIAAFLTANAVGVAAFLGINKAAQDTPAGSQNGCSPRECSYTDPQPCFCGQNVGQVSGASCGNTSGGIPFGGACALPNRPCSAGLSCNNGQCQDSAGRCPF